MAVSRPHEEFFNSAFGIWIVVNHVSDGFCRPIRMHKVWRTLVLRQQRAEQLSIMRHEVAMRRARVVPGKPGMSALMLALKEAEIKAEDIPVQMHQGHTETQNMRDNNETSTVMVNTGQIKKPQQYLYPLRKNGDRLHHRIMILDILREFYLVHRRHLLNLNN